MAAPGGTYTAPASKPLVMQFWGNLRRPTVVSINGLVARRMGPKPDMYPYYDALFRIQRLRLSKGSPELTENQLASLLDAMFIVFGGDIDPRERLYDTYMGVCNTFGDISPDAIVSYKAMLAIPDSIQPSDIMRWPSGQTITIDLVTEDDANTGRDAYLSTRRDPSIDYSETSGASYPRQQTQPPNDSICVRCSQTFGQHRSTGFNCPRVLPGQRLSGSGPWGETVFTRPFFDFECANCGQDRGSHSTSGDNRVRCRARDGEESEDDGWSKTSVFRRFDEPAPSRKIPWRRRPKPPLGKLLAPPVETKRPEPGHHVRQIRDLDLVL